MFEWRPSSVWALSQAAQFAALFLWHCSSGVVCSWDMCFTMELHLQRLEQLCNFSKHPWDFAQVMCLDLYSPSEAVTDSLLFLDLHGDHWLEASFHTCAMI